MNDKLFGLGRLTRVAICGLLAAAALPATALAEGGLGGITSPVPVTTPSVSTSVSTAVSTPSVPVSTPSVSTSTQVSTPVATAHVSASTSKPATTAKATVRTSSTSHRAATRHTARKNTAHRSHAKAHKRSHRAKPHRAAPSRKLASATSTTFEQYIPTGMTTFSCTNAAMVTVSGAEYIRITFTTTDSGNMMVDTYFHFFNVTGTTVMGTKFVSSSEGSSEFLLAKGQTSSLETNGHFVVSGELLPFDDFYLHENAHVTVTPAGAPVVDFDNTYADCR